MHWKEPMHCKQFDHTFGMVLQILTQASLTVKQVLTYQVFSFQIKYISIGQANYHLLHKPVIQAVPKPVIQTVPKYILAAKFSTQDVKSRILLALK